MKKLILILLLITSSAFGQGITVNNGINTSNPYTWTGTQTFSTLIANMIIANNIDSMKSTYWYTTNGGLWGFVDPSKDSSVVSNLYVQNRLSTTYIALNSANNFISRLAIGMTDSTGAFNIVRTDKNTNRSTLSQATDTSSFNFRFTPTGKPIFNIVDNLGSTLLRLDSTGMQFATNYLRPSVDYGSSLGSYLYRWDTLGVRTIHFGNGGYGVNRIYDGGAGGLFISGTGGTGGVQVGGSWVRITGTLGLSNSINGNVYPMNDTSFTVGISGTNRYKNIYTRTINADSVKVNTQILAPNGSSTAPSYSFSGKTNKGMYLIDTGNVGINGNLTVNGNLTSTNFAYGSVYIADDYPDTITVTSSSDYYTVGAKQGANGKAWTSGGVLKNVTVQDSSMTVSVAGKYEVSYSFSFKTITGVNNGRFNWYLFVNDVKQEKTGAKRLMSGTNDLGVGAIAPTVLNLNANDVIKLKVSSPDDNSNQIAFEYCIIHVKKIDN